MDLNTLWFILIGVVFCVFFFLEGFDYGVAILMPFLAKKEVEKRIIINTIGPVWDGNEVWMIVAGGAIFAVFPNWYATLFSGFYFLMFLILASLIIRNVSFEFRSKIDKPVWRTVWDRAFFIGSLIPAFIWGVIITNLLTGVPIDSKMEFAGRFSDLIKPAALAGGLMGLLLFTFNGAVFLSLRTEGTLLEKVKRLSLKIGITALAGEILLLAALLFQGLLFKKVPGSIFAILSFTLLAVVNVLLYYKKNKPAMLIMGLSIVTAVGAAFSSLFPKVMVSSLDPAFSLDIFNAASSSYTLKVITISACILLPIIIIYQAWTYWVFRKRVNSKNLEY